MPVLRDDWHILEKEKEPGLISEEVTRFAFEIVSVDFKHKLKLSLFPSRLFGSGAILI